MMCETTTTVVVSPTTIVGGPTTTTPVTGQGETTTTSDTPVTGQGETSTTAVVPLTQQAVPSSAPSATNLPETGSNTSLPVVFGAGCLAVGATLALRKRKTWTRP